MKVHQPQCRLKLFEDGVLEPEAYAKNWFAGASGGQEIAQLLGP